MQSLQQLALQFTEFFSVEHFPQAPATLYDPNRYFLELGGKRIRPLLVLMGNELFDDIKPDAWQVATAVELFHNFTLIHDDIMDKASLRRGKSTVHEKFGQHTAILAGDVMLVKAYEYLNKVNKDLVHPILKWFNRTAAEVCEGQQLDMDFEQMDSVSLEDYINMIALKTSVLLAGALRMGAVIGGGGSRNADHLYEFGKNLGIAFQVQDDYLDAFGNPEKFGKKVGGDILANKKTFLLIHALEVSTKEQKKALQELLPYNGEDKVEKVLAIYRETGAPEWALQLKDTYYQKSMHHLEEIAVISNRKTALREVAAFLIQRDY